MNTAKQNQNKLNNLKLGDSVNHSKKQLMESPELEKVAQRVIDKEGIELGPAEVGYLLVYPNLSKTNVGKTKKASKEENHYSGNNYIIEISGEVWDMLDNNTRERLMHFHILQMDPVYSAKKQEWKMKTRKPDFSDFYEINDTHGSDWYKAVQATVSSLYDLDPKKESKVSA